MWRTYVKVQLWMHLVHFIHHTIMDELARCNYRVQSMKTGCLGVAGFSSALTTESWKIQQDYTRIIVSADQVPMSHEDPAGCNKDYYQCRYDASSSLAMLKEQYMLHY